MMAPKSFHEVRGKLAVFCGWGGLGMLDAMERGAAGSMPAPNFTRVFAEVQFLYESGRVDDASNLFHRELPFILWAMQSLDFSVKSAKEELRRRGIFRTALQRQPAVDSMRSRSASWTGGSTPDWRHSGPDPTAGIRNGRDCTGSINYLSMQSVCSDTIVSSRALE